MEEVAIKVVEVTITAEVVVEEVQVAEDLEDLSHQQVIYLKN